LPTLEFSLYLATSAACIGVWAWAAIATANHTLVLTALSKYALAALAGFGPVVAAVVVSAIFRAGGGTKLFDPDHFVGSLAQWVVGTVFCAGSVFYGCLLAL
jgi:hypothetical protein